MRKKITALITLIIITILGIIIILNNKNKPYEITNDNDGQFAFFYEDDNGEYQRSTESKWNTGEYILNLESSSCDGEKNPSFLKWNNDNNSVTLTRNKATKCSLYFDIKTFDRTCNDNSFACYIAKKHDTQVGDKAGEELLYHNNTIDINNDGNPDDAGDLSYRYSGDNPDNFVCFGTNQSPCPAQNLYRIIGVFPFTKEDGSIEYRVKLIKSEYITQEELGIARYKQTSMNATDDGMASIEPRVQKTENVDNFQWVGKNPSNNWNNSQLKIALNDNYYNGFISNWKNMIISTNWIIGGFEGSVLNARNGYNVELGNKRLKIGDIKCVNSTSPDKVACTKEMLETQAPIGLMYVSDYLFSSAKDNWLKENYTVFENKANNWIYNGFYEYMITRSVTYNSALHIDNYGYVGSYGESTVNSQTIRPVFYLKSNVQYFSGTGTEIEPYKITEDTSNLLNNPFDKECESNSFACYIAQKRDTQVGDKQGEELLYHNNTIDVNNDGKPDDAGDFSYRYSGDNPDNFVCFGTDQSPCPVENLYRILGVFPFTKADGSIEYRVKLIKSEYITQDELGIERYSQQNAAQADAMEGIESRVHKNENVDYFDWKGTNANNNWKISPINIALNSTFYDKFPSKWQDMIYNSTWIIGGVETRYSPAKIFYNHELGSDRIQVGDQKCVDGNNTEIVNCTADMLETKAKIGLMYVTDYLYASIKQNWSGDVIGSYNTFANRANNYIYNGFYEHTITKNTENLDIIYHIDVYAYLGDWVRSKTIRPVFYLNSDVKYISGYGTELEPYIIG